MSAAHDDGTTRAEGPEEVGTVGEEAVKLLGAVSEAISGWESDPAHAGHGAAPSWSDGLAALAGDAAEALRAVQDAPPEEAGPGDAGPGDAGPRDAGPRDAGPRDEGGGAPRCEHEDALAGSARAACRWCPWCRAAHLLEETHPEVRVHLLSAARSLLKATALVLEQVQRDPPGAAPPETPTDPEPGSRARQGPRRAGPTGVEHIDLDDDGPPEPGTTSGPRGHDEEYW